MSLKMRGNYLAAVVMLGVMLASGCAGTTPVPQPQSSPATGLYQPFTQEPDPASGSGDVSDSW